MKINDLHREWLKREDYRLARLALAGEYAFAREVIHARVAAGLTQEQLASRMDTGEDSGSV